MECSIEYLGTLLRKHETPMQFPELLTWLAKVLHGHLEGSRPTSENRWSNAWKCPRDCMTCCRSEENHCYSWRNVVRKWQASDRRRILWSDRAFNSPYLQRKLHAEFNGLDHSCCWDTGRDEQSTPGSDKPSTSFMLWSTVKIIHAVGTPEVDMHIWEVYSNNIPGVTSLQRVSYCIRRLSISEVTILRTDDRVIDLLVCW